MANTGQKSNNQGQRGFALIAARVVSHLLNGPRAVTRSYPVATPTTQPLKPTSPYRRDQVR